MYDIYIYIERERDRETETDTETGERFQIEINNKYTSRGAFPNFSSA